MIEIIRTHGLLLRRLSDLRKVFPSLAPSVPGTPPNEKGFHWLDGAWYLRSLRAAVEHWLRHVKDEDLAPAWANEGFTVIDSFTAWIHFEAVLNLGLSEYHPRVELIWEFEAGRGWPDLGPLVRGEVVPDLFAAGCAQLHNIMLDKAPYHVCQNEKCGRTFMRKRGGATTGSQRTSSVAFCSRQCTNAQMQRVRRRRQAETPTESAPSTEGIEEND